MGDRLVIADVERIAELKVSARTAATLVVLTEAMAMLRSKGLLDDADFDRMFRKLEAHAAIMSTAAPEISNCLADAVLQLEHAFVEEKSKPN